MRLADPLAIVGVDDEDESLGVLEVVAPQRADLVLAADVPHGEANVLVLDRLDVEALNVKSVLRSLFICFMKTPHLPMVGIVVTISPSFSLYRMVVLPAASSPTVNFNSLVYGQGFYNANRIYGP